MAVNSWSHSKLMDFEKCKKYFWLKHDQKIPEPERPLPPGKTEHANDRGTRVHEACELFVKGQGKAPTEAMKFFDAEMVALCRLYEKGMVSLEGEWAMDREWNPVDWRGQWREIDEAAVADAVVQSLVQAPSRGTAGQIIRIKKKYYVWVPAWLRLKLDALVFLSPEEAIAIDYKTGKKFGNEVKHGEQLQLYQLVTFLRYPKLQKVHTELWYFDVDEITSQTFTRDQGLRFQRAWDKRGNAITTETDFKPNPNKFSCKWCMYGPWGTGHCSVGVK